MDTDSLEASKDALCALIVEREGNRSTRRKTLEVEERLNSETLSHETPHTKTPVLPKVLMMLQCSNEMFNALASSDSSLEIGFFYDFHL